MVIKGLTSLVYPSLDKKPGSGTSVTKELAQKLHKPAIKNFKKEKSTLGLKIIFGQQI